MASSTPEIERRPGRRRKAVVAVLLAFALLAAAWILAQYPPVQQAKEVEQVWSLPTGQILLVAGGLPWLLQWAGLAVLTVAVARGRFRVNWGAVLLGVLLPLCVGLTWWIGLCKMLWSSGLLEVIEEELAYAISGGTLWQQLLLELSGPLTYPLKQRGPVSLEGWEFLWTGLSTALVMSSLTWVARTRRVDASGSPKWTWRQVGLIVIWGLLYFGPIYVRTASEIIDSLRGMPPASP
jgi:hypothetical protein